MLLHYPQLVDTYVETELRALARDHDLCVVTQHGLRSRDGGRGSHEFGYRDHQPYRVISDAQALDAIIREFRPDVIHGHWLTTSQSIYQLARRHDLPFTIRAHSFDTLPAAGVPEWLTRTWKDLAQVTSHPLCLGLLAFPFSRGHLESLGVPSEKIRDCYPVLDLERFLDTSPNGADVMNVGSGLPNRRMEDFLALSRAVPSRHFRLYAVGYQRNKLRDQAIATAAPVEFSEPIEPSDMPGEYKRHAWLVCTASFEGPSIGWPVCVAEAQASGVGVVLAGVRPDLAEYLGQAGFLFSSLEQVPPLLRGEVPDQVRERGFEVARRSDVRRHLHLLTDLWAAAGVARPPSPSAAGRFTE